MAAGAKYNDIGRTRTISYQTHYRFSAGSDAAGYWSTLFLPNHTYQPTAGVNTGLSAAFSAALVTNTNILANVQSYRITSYGAIFRVTQAPLTTAGMLRVRKFSPKVGTTVAVIDVSTYNCDDFIDVPLSRATEVCVAASRTDASALLMILPSTTTPSTAVSAWVSPGWDCFTISVDGAAASTTVGDVEIFANYEVTLADDNVMAQMGTPSPKDNSFITDAINAASSVAVPIVKDGVAAFTKLAVKNAARAVATTVGAYLGGPSGAAVGRLTANMATARIVD